MYDVSKILFVSRDLAENYIIDTKNVAGMLIWNGSISIEHTIWRLLLVPEMCRYNKEVAQQFGYPDIAQCWALAEIVATSANETESESDDMVFNQIPFPKNILESL